MHEMLMRKIYECDDLRAELDVAREEVERLTAILGESLSRGVISIDGVNLIEENERLAKRIAALESAAEWRSASEPPEDDRRILVILPYTIEEGRYRQDLKEWHVKGYVIRDGDVKGWTEWPDLPPIPSGEG